MSVYIDVWHRTHPLTPEAHARFLDYYARHVVAPPSDFFEGIRAALVDKDRSPKWDPDALPAVSDAAVASFLANLGDRELELPLLTPAFKPV